jgi:excisionase family DNA binding protein
MEQLTMTVEQAAKALGINRNSAYEAARHGDIPAIRIGRRLLVVKAAFERMLENAGSEKPRRVTRGG